MNRAHDERDEIAAQIEKALIELEEIANLPSFLDDAIPFFERRRDYQAFWQKAKEVSALFKDSHLRRDVRERLWAKHSSLCERVKDLQNHEREQRFHKSKQDRDQILSILREAHNWAKGARELSHLTEARKQLGEAMQLMKDKFLLKDDRDECWKLWREVNDLIPFRRKEICEGHYVEFRNELSRIANLATYGKPREALRAIQEVQREIKAAELTRDQRRWLRDDLQKYWDVAMSRLQERRTELARKHEEWRGRMEEKCNRLEALIKKNEGAIARLRDQIDDLESKIATAWNEDWADRAREWVQEKYNKIADIERTNEELEEKIREIRSKLNN